MIQLVCPHCGERFGLLSRKWQAQRKLGAKRFCPSCSREVFVKFKAGRFFPALTCVVLAGIALTHFAGENGFLISFFAACTLPVVFSTYLDR